jgi:uncharacterized protein YkuJ
MSNFIRQAEKKEVPRWHKKSEIIQNGGWCMVEVKFSQRNNVVSVSTIENYHQRTKCLFGAIQGNAYHSLTKQGLTVALAFHNNNNIFAHCYSKICV